MTDQNPILIIGAGQAGVQVADSLRAEGYRGQVAVLNPEKILPYQRPQLSKDFLTADESTPVLPLRGEDFYRENQIELLHNAAVSGIEPATHTVHLEEGGQLHYSQLVIATGTRAREMNIPGSHLEGIHYVRTLDDARGLRTELASARRIVVVGAGFIGLEVAAAAVKLGIEVTVLSGCQAPMARSVSASVSEWFSRYHRDRGVHLVDGASASSFEGSAGCVDEVISDTGQRYPADLVVVGIGALPNVEFLEGSGLELNNGVCVDDQLRTNIPGIWALGDCAVLPSRQRLESVQNATDQGRLLARNLVASNNLLPLEGYDALPWFWSHQGDAKLQIAGLRPHSHGEPLLLGSPENKKFSVLIFDDFDELVAVESVNSPADHMAARKILSQPLPLTREVAGATGFTLKAHSRAVPAISS